jgi:hypothetical protein
LLFRCNNYTVNFQGKQKTTRKKKNMVPMSKWLIQGGEKEGGPETNVKAVEKLTEIPSKNVKKTLLLSKP